MPAPTPPKTTSLSWMFASGDEAADRRERVVPAVDRAAARVGGRGGKQRGVGDAEPDFLSLHVAARGRGAHRLIRAGGRQQRVPARLGPIRRRHAGQEEKRHRAPYRPAVLRASRSWSPACT